MLYTLLTLLIRLTMTPIKYIIIHHSIVQFISCRKYERSGRIYLEDTVRKCLNHLVL